MRRHQSTARPVTDWNCTGVVGHGLIGMRCSIWHELASGVTNSTLLLVAKSVTAMNTSPSPSSTARPDVDDVNVIGPMFVWHTDSSGGVQDSEYSCRLFRLSIMNRRRRLSTHSRPVITALAGSRIGMGPHR